MLTTKKGCEKLLKLAEEFLEKAKPYLNME